MNRLAFTALALALSVAAGHAVAGAQDYGHGSTYSPNYDPGYDASQHPDRGPRNDYAQVTRVDRLGDQRGAYQRQECWNEQSSRYDNDYYRDSSGRLYRGDSRGNASGAVIGALVGGVLGNQVGSGDGRTAATIAGVVIGATVGSQIGDNDGHDRYRDSAGVVRRCRTLGDYDDGQGLASYGVTYVYAGQTYHTVTNYDPGRTIRVVVDVRPQDDYVAYRR